MRPFGGARRCVNRETRLQVSQAEPCPTGATIKLDPKDALTSAIALRFKKNMHRDSSRILQRPRRQPSPRRRRSLSPSAACLPYLLQPRQSRTSPGRTLNVSCFFRPHCLFGACPGSSAAGSALQLAGLRGASDSRGGRSRCLA